MKLSELKDGAVVELRNGWQYMKVGDTLMHCPTDDKFLLLSDYDENMHYRKDERRDIVKYNNLVEKESGGITNAITQVKYHDEWEWEEGLDELKPCPFCGGKAHFIFDHNREYLYVGCNNCRIKLGGFNPRTKDKAIKCWNTRKGENQHENN